MVVMGEGDINDCWSLLAIVNESSRMSKTRAQLVINDNALKTTTFAAATPTPTPTPTPQLDYIDMDHYSYSGHSSFFDDHFMSMNNSSGFWLPSTSAGAVMSVPANADVTSSDEEFGGFWLSSAEGAVTTISAPSADVTSSEEELRGPFLVPYKPPAVCNNAKAEPVVVTGGVASNPVVELNSRRHPCPKDSQMIPNQSPPAAVTRGRKKKKLENRTIVRLKEEELPKSDNWSWRKYGQKPIKGSEHPRNYYRCSTLKGCKARKQVELCPIDSKTYIVTYCNNHHHPYPSIRNTPGPRVRYTTKSGKNPAPKVESPTNTGSGPAGGTNNGVIKIIDADDDCDKYVGGDNSSFSSEEMINEGYIYNSADFQIPVIMNSMTYSEQQNGEGNSSGITITTNNNNSNNDSNYYYSYCDENNNNNAGCNCGCDPNVNMGVRMEEDGSGYDVGNGEMYAPAPATNGSGNGVGSREMNAPAPATNGSGYGVGKGDVYAPVSPMNGSDYGVGNGDVYAPAPAMNRSGYGVGNGDVYAPAPAMNGSGYGVGNGDVYAPAPAMNGSGYGVGNGDVYAPSPAMNGPGYSVGYAPAPITSNGSGYIVGNREMSTPAPATMNGSGYGVGNREMYAPAPATMNGSGYGVGNREMCAPAPATMNGSGYGVGNREMYAPAPATMNGSGCGVGNREMYAPAPATLAGVNQLPPNYVGPNSKFIWNIEMIKNARGFFYS